MVRIAWRQCALKPGNELNAKLNRSKRDESERDALTEGEYSGLLRANHHVSPHVMRHTCATRFVAEGIPIDAVQLHLGHSSISTTAIYLHNSIDLGATFARMAGEVTA